MKRSMTVLLLALTLAGCSGESEPPVSDADMLRAQVLLSPFKSQLVEALTTAVAQGPVNAIEFCNMEAPEIADAMSAGGLEVGRTSHRLRNPANAPEPWMEPLLAGYVESGEQGAPRAVRLEDGRIGYVEPIYIKPVCLACHGDAVRDDVAQVLASLYPQDQAMGFTQAEFRGMFWLKMPAETRAHIAE